MHNENHDTPEAAVAALMRAVEAGDADAARRLYTDDAVFVAEPGVVLQGAAQVGGALAELCALRARIRSTRCSVLGSGDVALYQAEWTMQATAPDGSAIEQRGISADLLRRGADGGWRIAVDNPWGALQLTAA